MIYSLNSFAKKEEVGNKAFVLMQLSRSNYNVPKGFVISTQVKEVENIKNEIKKYFNEIISEFPVIVRSSSPHEDSKNFSYAGQFKSILNVNSFDEMIKAIIEVKNSAFGNFGNYGKKRDEKIAVIVQKQINPQYSGVFFTQNPVSPGFIIEYVKGHLGEMVSGKENSYKITSLNSLDKSFLELYKIGKQIEDYYDSPQDIEFIISEGKIWVVQSRPITTIKKKDYKKIDLRKHIESMSGKTLSLGNVKGKIQFIYDDLTPEEAERIFKKGNILGTYVLFPEFNRIYQKAKGVICMVDSITSHPAIVSRELGIPCVGGINITEFSKKVKDFDEIMINADEGKIFFKSRIKKVLEKHDKGITKIDFPSSKKFLEYEDRIKKHIENLDYKNLDKEILNTKEEMKNNFLNFLKNNSSENLYEAKSFLYNLSDLLQNKFILILKNKRFSHKELLKSFSNVDSGQAKGELDKVYKTIKKHIQNLDEYSIIDGKKIWDYK